MNGNSQQSTVNDRIWITSRVRMLSEKRARRNNFWSLLLLTYYSLITVILSVFSGYYSQQYGQFNGIVTAASVAVLVASLVVSGFRFERTASLYRDCYLSLQRLISQPIPGSEKEEAYTNILQLYPNQSVGDYYDFLVFHTRFENKKVWNGDTNITYTKFMLASFIVRRILFFTFITLCTLIPIALLFAPLACGVRN